MKSDKAMFQREIVDCIDLRLIPKDLPWGKLSAVAGDAAYRYVEVAANFAMNKSVAAICTAPLNKEALQAGGHHFPGHTELLASLTGTEEVSMMLSTPKMRVIHVTTHIGLIDAIAKIEPGLVERTIARGHAALVSAGIANPRIAVCGINPHAGENGLFGYGEEETKIAPAIVACKKKGWSVEGPLPADTLFFRAQRGDFDLVVAMYHDQGHGPVKALGLESGVNITIGLPSFALQSIMEPHSILRERERLMSAACWRPCVSLSNLRRAMPKDNGARLLFDPINIGNAEMRVEYLVCRTCRAAWFHLENRLPWTCPCRLCTLESGWCLCYIF